MLLNPPVPFPMREGGEVRTDKEKFLPASGRGRGLGM